MTDDDLIHDRYRLVEVLGQGAMGVVWRAHDSVLDREIALKELRPAPGVDPIEAKERFLVEARAAARLTHPNIVGIHDVFSDDERVLIAMELVEGPTLDELVRSGAQFPSVVREVMAQVAQALAVAHGQGVIHRDLKPDNIFWSNGRAVVADFGLARIGAGKGTVEGTVMGTPGYMSPEQVKGTATGPQTDVFGWAAVAYQLVAGIPPFGEPLESDITAMAYRVVHQDPPALDLPGDPDLAALITRALAKDPAERPTDGAALVAGLMQTGQVEAVAPLLGGVGGEAEAGEAAGEVKMAPETAAAGQPEDQVVVPELADSYSTEHEDLSVDHQLSPNKPRSRGVWLAGIGVTVTILALFGALMFTMGQKGTKEIVVGAIGDSVGISATTTAPATSNDQSSTTAETTVMPLVTTPYSAGSPVNAIPPVDNGKIRPLVTSLPATGQPDLPQVKKPNEGDIKEPPKARVTTTTERPTTTTQRTTTTTTTSAAAKVRATVSSTAEWQQAPVILSENDPYVITYQSGQWSVDSRNLPYVGIDGYASSVDSDIYQACKIDPGLQYGLMFAKIGDGRAFVVRSGVTNSALNDGSLFLRIHDQDRCLADNDGAIVVQVTSG